MTELRPCPMCGGVPTLFPTGVSPEAWVLCKHCGTGGPTTSDTTRAAKKWNTRPAEDELLDALDNLLGHWRAFNTPEWGNQERAYYCLAKGAQKTWADAEALLTKHRPEKKP